MSLVGTFIEVYEATTSRKILEFFRLRIRMSLGALANLFKVVRINDVLCKIFSEEMAVVQTVALVNELTYKNVTAFFTKAFERKAALNKPHLFIHFVLVFVLL